MTTFEGRTYLVQAGVRGLTVSIQTTNGDWRRTNSLRIRDAVIALYHAQADAQADAEEAAERGENVTNSA